MKIKLKLQHVKSTKGTEVFGTDAEDAAVTQLYVRKSALKGAVPKTVTLTLEGGTSNPLEE